MRSAKIPQKLLKARWIRYSSRQVKLDLALFSLREKMANTGWIQCLEGQVQSTHFCSPIWRTDTEVCFWDRDKESGYICFNTPLKQLYFLFFFFLADLIFSSHHSLVGQLPNHKVIWGLLRGWCEDNGKFWPGRIYLWNHKYSGLRRKKNSGDPMAVLHCIENLSTLM